MRVKCLAQVYNTRNIIIFGHVQISIQGPSAPQASTITNKQEHLASLFLLTLRM